MKKVSNFLFLSLWVWGRSRKRRIVSILHCLAVLSILFFNLYFCFFFLYFISKNKKLSHFLQSFFPFYEASAFCTLLLFLLLPFSFSLKCSSISSKFSGFMGSQCATCYMLFPVKPTSRFWYECFYSNKLLPTRTWEPKLKHPTNFNFSATSFVVSFLWISEFSD